MDRYLGHILLSILLVWWAGSCSDEPAPHLIIGSNLWTGYEPLYLARDLGYFKGSRIHLVEYSSATQAIRDFNNQTINAAALTLDEAMQLIQYGNEVYIVLVTDISHGGDAILAHPAFKSVRALAGRRIGSENTALGAYVLRRAMDIAGVSSKELVVVLKERSELFEAYRNGEVDAVVTFDPIRTQLLNEGAVTVFDSKQIPGEIIDVIVVRKDYFDNYSQQVTNLLSAWFKSIAYIDTNYDHASQLISTRMNMSQQELKQSFSNIRIPGAAENHDLIYSGRERSTLMAAMKNLKAIMLEHNLLYEDINIDSFLIEDASYYLNIESALENDKK